MSHQPRHREPAGPLETEVSCPECNTHLAEPSSGRYVAPVETYRYILDDLANVLGVQIHGYNQQASADVGRGAPIERWGAHAQLRALADALDLNGLVIRPGDEGQVYVQSEASDLDCIVQELRELRALVHEQNILVSELLFD